jgi:hypothetical protein
VTAEERAALSDRLDEWLIAEVLRIGPDRIRRADAAELLIEGGLSRSTAFAWVAEALTSGRIGRAVERRLRESVETRAAAAGISASECAARQAAQVLPTVPSIEDAAAATDNAVNVIRELHTAIQDTKLVREAAFADGKVRNAKMLLRAVETMRRNLETAAKLQAAMHELASVERFHKAIVSEIAQESPELAQRVMARLNNLATAWGG